MDIEAYIASGILEEYVLGTVSEKEREEIGMLADQYPEIRSEIDAIELSIAAYSKEFAMAPPDDLKSNIFKRIEAEESLLRPPVLSPQSKVSDYDHWLNSVPTPSNYENLHMEVIDPNEAATLVIGWVKLGEENHTHDSYTEQFLIVEGACIATIGGSTNHYGVGDYVEFPIHVPHSYKVTSDVPMKVVACLNRALS